MGINLWGVIYGTKAFLPYIKQTGDGHVINVSSIFGLFAQPTQSGYNMTKFAVRGFTESLRQELDLQNCGVSATCVHPGGIKTNIARSARMSNSVLSLTGGKGSTEKMTQQFEKMFVTTPETAANVILNAVKRNSRRVLIGNDAKATDLMQRMLPTIYQKIVTTSFKLANR
jgi:short-subunit dehydrogenase